VDFVVVLLFNLIVLALVVAALRLAGWVRVDLRWAMLALGLICVEFLAVVYGRFILSLSSIYPKMDWNWAGKVLSILLWGIVLLVTMRLKEGFRPADAGFSLRQKRGSLVPAMVALVVCIALGVIEEHLSGSPGYDAVELWFQALIPGLDEEPWFRGLLQYFVTLAVASRRLNVLGAPINVAGILLTLLFGMGHGVRFAGHALHMDVPIILVTGRGGFLFLWLRERTGSLSMPILAHNAWNLLARFI
jgi:membrane protease YdiL (CAAX protease family)